METKKTFGELKVGDKVYLQWDDSKKVWEFILKKIAEIIDAPSGYLFLCLILAGDSKFLVSPCESVCGLSSSGFILHANKPTNAKITKRVR